MPKGSYVRTAEHRRILSESQKGKKLTEAHKAKIGAGRAAHSRGFYIAREGGYKILTGQYDHPLAVGAGALAEHRKVLYDKIGPGPHECYWNHVSGCGAMSLEWKGHSLHPDHLDADTSNNDPANLVPSCSRCNVRRAKVGNPIDWDGTIITIKTPMGLIMTTESRANVWRNLLEVQL